MKVKTKYYRKYRNFLTSTVKMFPSAKMVLSNERYNVYYPSDEVQFDGKIPIEHLYSLLPNGGETVVTIDDTYVGVAKCSDEDAFVREMGREIAYRRAYEIRERESLACNFYRTKEESLNLELQYIAILQRHANGQVKIFTITNIQPSGAGAITTVLDNFDIDASKITPITRAEFIDAYKRIVTPHQALIAEKVFS